MKGRRTNIKRWGTDIILVGLLGGLLVYGDLLEYGIRMGWGQVKIVLKARPVKTYLADPEVPDSLKANVRLIQDIKQFCYDSLGMNYSPNYNKVYDQKGKPLLWVVTACKKFSLEPKIWSFPVVGKVTYKGFFSEKQAKYEEEQLQQAGYETKIRTVDAWSTLGWFRDPIMSSMLYDSPGEIANVIIHELSHGTIFVKNNVEYSENLANFIGDQGSYMYLKARYGEESEEYRSFYEENEDYNRFAAHFVKSAARLDSLYKTFSGQYLTEEVMQERKDLMISDIVKGLDTVPFYDTIYYRSIFRNKKPNNAFFIIYLQYNNQQDEFHREFEEVAGSNLRTYVDYLSRKFQ